ncbi:suppressor of deletion of TFIIS [Dipsacomyces acuminosporus]|nr:suppressor of deletion of TFIIS [Dipsacomyces acuminosporus]
MGSLSCEPIFFFDIDNCLYPLDLGVDKLMKQRIYAFAREIGLDEDSVIATCSSYYMDYGLSVRGLIKHHNIDPTDYNEKVDGSLPLEDVIKPDPELRRMIQSMKIRKWAFTNAGLEHAKRVLRCLQIDDLFEGITFCDYSEPNFPCKPEPPAYERVMKQAGVDDPRVCYFADDSAKNVEAAKSLGWTAIHVSRHAGNAKDGGHQISTIHELPSILPQLFS